MPIRVAGSRLKSPFLSETIYSPKVISRFLSHEVNGRLSYFSDKYLVFSWQTGHLRWISKYEYAQNRPEVSYLFVDSTQNIINVLGNADQDLLEIKPYLVRQFKKVATAEYDQVRLAILSGTDLKAVFQRIYSNDPRILLCHHLNPDYDYKPFLKEWLEINGDRVLYTLDTFAPFITQQAYPLNEFKHAHDHLSPLSFEAVMSNAPFTIRPSLIPDIRDVYQLLTSRSNQMDYLNHIQPVITNIQDLADYLSLQSKVSSPFIQKTSLNQNIIPLLQQEAKEQNADKRLQTILNSPTKLGTYIRVKENPSIDRQEEPQR